MESSIGSFGFVVKAIFSESQIKKLSEFGQPKPAKNCPVNCLIKKVIT